MRERLRAAARWAADHPREVADGLMAACALACYALDCRLRRGPDA